MEQTAQQSVGDLRGFSVAEIDDDQTKGAASQQAIGGPGLPLWPIEAHHGQRRPVDGARDHVRGIKERSRRPYPGRRLAMAMGLGDTLDGGGDVGVAPIGTEFAEPTTERGQA